MEFALSSLPKYAIGTKTDFSKVASYNKASYIRMVIRTVVSRHRETINRMRREGYTFNDAVGTKLPASAKKIIREELEFMRTADSVHLMGTSPGGCLVNGHIMNQCYVTDQHIGCIYWHYYLLFRKRQDGNDLAYLFPEPLLQESEVNPIN